MVKLRLPISMVAVMAMPAARWLRYVRNGRDIRHASRKRLARATIMLLVADAAERVVVWLGICVGRFTVYVCLLLAIALGIYLVPAVRQTSFYEKALPPQLVTSGFVRQGSDVGVLDFFAREACGAVVFDLSSETIESIRRDGLSFFRDATQGRGYPGSYYYHYQPWQQTPTPGWFGGEGIATMSLHCAGFSKDLIRRIADASGRGGGFYTTKDEAQLIVLPDEGIAVLTYYG